MSTTTAPEPEPPPLAVASGVPLAVFAFGFSVMSLSLANAELFNLNASLFVPVAFGTGALGMLAHLLLARALVADHPGEARVYRGGRGQQAGTDVLLGAGRDAEHSARVLVRVVGGDRQHIRNVVSLERLRDGVGQVRA